MKPSERRAMEAEKRAAREAAARERELERQASKPKSGTSEPEKENGFNSDAPYYKPKEEEIRVEGDGYHKESFFSNHVRLITFIVTVALILTVLGPIGIDMLVDKSREEVFGESVTDKKDITPGAIRELAELGNDMRWKHLDNFNYTDHSREVKKNGKKVTQYIREYELAFNLVLRVEGYDMGKAPDIVRLIDYDAEEFVPDVRTGNVETFLAKRGY